MALIAITYKCSWPCWCLIFLFPPLSLTPAHFTQLQCIHWPSLHSSNTSSPSNLRNFMLPLPSVWMLFHQVFARLTPYHSDHFFVCNPRHLQTTQNTSQELLVCLWDCSPEIHINHFFLVLAQQDLIFFLFNRALFWRQTGLQTEDCGWWKEANNERTEKELPHDHSDLQT